MTCTASQTAVNNSNYGPHLTPSYNVTCSSDVSGYESFVTVLQTTVIAVISCAIIVSNIVNLVVLASASAAMPWATRLFLVNLSSSDLMPWTTRLFLINLSSSAWTTRLFLINLSSSDLMPWTTRLFLVNLSSSDLMPWTIRLFLINLSSSDLLVGVVACAPAVLPAATDRWTYGVRTYLARRDGQVDLR